MNELERHNERCFDLLRSVANVVPLGVIGSAALLLHHRAARSRYRLPDLDVVIRPEHVPRFDAWVRSKGGRTMVWNEPYDASTVLTGKFYARAVVDEVQVDASFELSLESIEVFLGSITLVDGLPVCSERLVRRLKQRARPDVYEAFLETAGLNRAKRSQRR